MPGSVRDKGEAYQQLEAILLRQMLQSSGAFKAGTTPGAQLRTDMFVETLADAVAKAGGLGIARMLERQLGGGAGAGAGQDPHGGGTPKALKGIPGLHLLPMSRIPASPSASAFPSVSPSPSLPPGDSLEDPNNDAPLPEDPTAGSIDDYQPRQSHSRAISLGRALNSYRGRAEAPIGSTPTGALGGGEKP